MKTELKDVIHFYIGCKVTHVTRDKEVIDIERMIGVSESEMHPGQITVITSDNHTEWAVSDVLPILRRLSSMTEEDVLSWGEVTVTSTPYCVELDSKDEFGEFTEVYSDGSILSRSKDDGESRPINGGQLFVLLLSKGFDLFNLIDSGQAIEQTPEK